MPLQGYTIVNNSAQVACGSCIDLMRAIPDNSVDLVLTDPPYNLGLFMKERGTNMEKLRPNHFAFQGWDDLDFKTWSEQMNQFLTECHRVLKKRGALIIFMSVIKVESIINLAQDNGFYYKTTGIWHKTNPLPRNMNLQFVNSTEAWLYFVFKGTTGTFNNGKKVVHDYVETSVVPLSEKKFGKHPTQKPIALMEHFVKLLTNKGDTVLDPFMGSGSSGVASLKLGRKFVGIEMSKEYFNLAQKRMAEK